VLGIVFVAAVLGSLAVRFLARDRGDAQLKAA